MQRAKTWWLEGLLHDRLGNSEDSWRALDIARRSLLALRAEAELGAIVADMARISPEPLIVNCICREALNVVADPHPLAQPLRRLKAASRKTIPIAIAALHQATQNLTPAQFSGAFGVSD